MKKFIALILIIALMPVFAGSSVVFSSYNEIGVYLNGERLEFDVPPQIIGYLVMVPIRVISEALGLEVSWTDEERRRGLERLVSVSERMAPNSLVVNIVIFFRINEPSIDISISGIQPPALPSGRFPLRAPPQIINNRTLVPLDAVQIMLRTFGAEVDWDETTRTITINHSNIPG